MTFAPLLNHAQKAAQRSAIENKFGLLRRFSRLCPACMSDYGLWKKSWRHAAVVACPEHELVLVGSCHACEHLWFSNGNKNVVLNPARHITVSHDRAGEARHGAIVPYMARNPVVFSRPWGVTPPDRIRRRSAGHGAAARGLREAHLVEG